MLPSEVRVGYVFRYGYLWHQRQLHRHEEAEKDRPCLVLALVTILEHGRPVVRVLPITHRPPSDPEEAIEIPPSVKARLGLDEARSWVTLSESNRFVWPGPDLRHVNSGSGYYGAIPPKLFAEVRRRFVALARGSKHRSVVRD